jgi:hypothetical protein
VLRFLLSLMHFMCIMMFIFIPRILRVVQRTCPLMGALALGEILFLALTSFKKNLVCHIWPFLDCLDQCGNNVGTSLQTC